MSRVRLHIPAGRWAQRVELEPSEQKHLVDVLRLKTGAQLEVFDGQGGVCQATLLRAGKRASLELGERLRRPDRGPITQLGVALLKGRKLDGVVRMLTEIGVDQIRPFTCERSVSRPDRARLDNRLKRWKTIATEAARQCGRSSVLKLSPCTSLEQLLAEEPRQPGGTLRALLHEKEDGQTLQDLLESNPIAERFVLIGPEGGFTSSEVGRARDAGFSIAGLGLPVLRAETAAVAAAAFACLDRRPLVE